MFGEWLRYASIMSNLPPSRTAPKMLLRLPAGLKDHLSELAAANGRSINAQVIALLEAALERDAIDSDLPNLVDDHEKRISDLERRMEDVFHMAGWRDYPGNED